MSDTSYYRRTFNTLEEMLTYLNGLEGFIAELMTAIRPELDYALDPDAYVADFFARLTDYVYNVDHSPTSFEIRVTGDSVIITRNSLLMLTTIEGDGVWYAEIDMDYLAGGWDRILT